MRRLAKLAVLPFVALLLVACGNSAAAGFGTHSSTELTESGLHQLLLAKPPVISELVFDGPVVHVKSMGQSQAAIVNVPDESARTELKRLARENNVNYWSIESDSGSPGFFSIVLSLLPLLMFAILLWFVISSRRANGNQTGSVGTFGKHKGKRFSPAQGRVVFADVTGQEEAKGELGEVVEFLRNPGKFKRLGAKILNGVLLIGPPGTGKTLLARAVAGEAGVPFFYISGSEFVEMFVGVGAARVRDLFEEAKRAAPSIVFVDEIDAVGRQRGSGLGGSHDEREQTLNQILVEMDGFDKTGASVVVIAATNRPDVLDPALLRSGRFTRHVTVERPDYLGRLSTFQLYLKGKAVSAAVDLLFFAKSTPGLSQADIADICNDAAILRGRRMAEAERTGADVPSEIQPQDLDDAISRKEHGPARASLAKVMSAEVKRNTAIHEASHAVAFHVMTRGAPIRKITIMPTTRALGYVQTLQEIDQFNMTRQQIIANIVMGLAGAAGQRVHLNVDDTGCASDYKQVWNWARAMVAEFGMSKLGVIYAPVGEEHPFLGGHLNDGTRIGPKLQDEIDEEVRAVITECRRQAREIVHKYGAEIRCLADILVERETILGPEFAQIMASRISKTGWDRS